MAFAFRQAAAHLHLYSVRLTQRIMEQIRLQRKRYMSLGKLSDLEQAHNDLEPSLGSTVAAELNILCQDIAIERAARTERRQTPSSFLRNKLQRTVTLGRRRLAT